MRMRTHITEEQWATLIVIGWVLLSLSASAG